MKRKILKSAVSALILFTLIFSTVAHAIQPPVYTNTRWLANNLQYINTISWLGAPGRVESHTLRLTGPGDAYPIVMSGESILGTTRISEMVYLAEQMGKNVLAAVNADFFSMRTGVPIGLVIENGVFKSSPYGGTAVAFDNNGGVFFTENPRVQMILTNNGGSLYSDNAGQVINNIHHFNKYRMDTGGMYLFSEDFSEDDTRTSSYGWAVRFRILYGVPTIGGEMMLEVVDMYTSSESTYIGAGYIVLSSAMQSGWIAEMNKFDIGDIVTLAISSNDSRLNYAQFATGAGNMLITDGVITDPDEWTPVLVPRAPRTAFGVRADGSVISIVSDGRNAPYSVGFTKMELAEELLRQGAVHAVNFDGGGSSAISVRLPGEYTGAVLNNPSDGVERGAATYILFVTDAHPDGFARNLHLRNDGIIVLTGSSASINFTATDRGYMPAVLPYDIVATPASWDSFVADGVFTAGHTPGIETLSLSSMSTGATGTGEIFVISEPTSILPRQRGSTTTLTSVALRPGQVLELDIGATFYRRHVYAQPHSFTYEVYGNIGEMIAPGVFAASDTMLETGTITVSAGNRSAVIKVEIGGFADMRNHWAEEYVAYLHSEGIVNGLTPTTFGPERDIRRGDFVLMLYRAVGLPPIYEYSGFYDVYDGAYYAAAVAWAREAGIALGTGDNMFNPHSTLTRQQAFTFVYRALGALGVELDFEYLPAQLAPVHEQVSYEADHEPHEYENGYEHEYEHSGYTDDYGYEYDDGNDYDPTDYDDDDYYDDHKQDVTDYAHILREFADYYTVAEFAVVPTATLIRLGIVSGSNGRLLPESGLTRAQMARILAAVLWL